MNEMFCFQCEQTAACTGCTGKAGVCGKTADVAQLQDELTGALIGLARATDGGMQATPEAWRLMIEGLFTTVTNVNFNEKTIRELIGRVHAEKAQLVPDCSSCAAPCGRTSDYDMNLLWSADEDIRSLKSLVLFGVRGMAAYAHHAMVLGYTDDEVNRFFAKALFAIGEDPDRPGLVGTPDRVARACEEIFGGMQEDPGHYLRKQFHEPGNEEMVVVRDIPFASMCEHHILPFMGKASVCYIPRDGRITGLSKIARCVTGYAHRPQLQERLTSQIADAMVRELNPLGVLVVIQAEHTCMTIRGIRTPGAQTVTSAVRGTFKNDMKTRAEALRLLGL